MRLKLLPGVAAAVLPFFGAPFIHASVITTPSSDIVGVEHDLNNHWSVLNTNYPGAEAPAKAIDGDLNSKYLNFAGAGLDGSGNQVSNPTGFIVTLPSAVALSSFRMATANDFPSRDPATVTIEGGNFSGESSTDIANSDSDSDWTLLYSGPSGIVTDQARNTFAPVVSFAPSDAYSSFRFIITDLVRYAGNAPTNSQFSEIEINSAPAPEPGSLALMAIGSTGLLRRRRRR